MTWAWPSTLQHSPICCPLSYSGLLGWTSIWVSSNSPPSGTNQMGLSNDPPTVGYGPLNLPGWKEVLESQRRFKEFVGLSIPELFPGWCLNMPHLLKGLIESARAVDSFLKGILELLVAPGRDEDGGHSSVLWSVCWDWEGQQRCHLGDRLLEVWRGRLVLQGHIGMSGTQNELTFWEVPLSLELGSLLIPALLACSCEKAELDLLRVSS